jgi:hypothetical protein
MDKRHAHRSPGDQYSLVPPSASRGRRRMEATRRERGGLRSACDLLAIRLVARYTGVWVRKNCSRQGWQGGGRCGCEMWRSGSKYR